MNQRGATYPGKMRDNGISRFKHTLLGRGDARRGVRAEALEGIHFDSGTKAARSPAQFHPYIILWISTGPCGSPNGDEDRATPYTGERATPYTCTRESPSGTTAVGTRNVLKDTAKSLDVLTWNALVMTETHPVPVGIHGTTRPTAMIQCRA